MTFDQLYDGKGMPSIPDELFKYTDIEGASKILTNCSLRFRAPSEFNDPFDLRAVRVIDGTLDELLDELASEATDVILNAADFEGSDNDLISLVISRFRDRAPNLRKLTNPRDPVMKWFQENRSILKDKIHNHIETLQSSWERTAGIAVLCLSSQNDNILMWSHYAHHHRGVILGFQNTKGTFFETAKPIHYSDHIPNLLSTKGFARVLTGQTREDLNVVLQLSSFQVALTKSTGWCYEQEWRCVTELETKDNDYLDKPFPPDTLRTVIFGCQCTYEDRARILSILQDRPFPQVDTYQAVKSRSEFGLVLDPLDM